MAKIRKKVYAIYVDAGNDTNGNPRRGWVLNDKEGKYLGFLDEEYNGYSILRRAIPNVVDLGGGYGISVTKYRELKKDDISPLL